MLSLGYDIGSSSIKCAIIDCDGGKILAQGSYPAEEMQISSPRTGEAEQNPEMWWDYIKILTNKLLKEHRIDAAAIRSIGISYQMHGLVLVDKHQHVLRPSIIWCDSRAVEIGNNAFTTLGKEFCSHHLLNSPGNFTASKLRWVKENEPDVFQKIDKAMLPGDFIAMKLTGEISTTISGLSEGIFWDFKTDSLSKEILKHYEISDHLLPKINPTFSIQGTLTKEAATELGLREGTVVSYRAGDQPNNAFSLNVLNPGEIAATAGTSGVVYGVIDNVQHDPQSRVNSFAHVNYTAQQKRLGVLLCINGTGILNSWLRKNIGNGISYNEMNASAGKVAVGSDGITILPFGNGAERVLENKNTGGQILGLDFNRHSSSHIFRAAHEGIAFSFQYGIEVMKGMGLDISVIRAGNANMFLSPIFRETLANISGASIELYDTDGSVGAARGAAVGAGIYQSFSEAFATLQKIQVIHPHIQQKELYRQAYEQWLQRLRLFL